MVYDNLNRQWLPSGSSSGLSKVHIYQHMVHNTFRVVGRKLQDHEVVINCAILKGLKYNQATPTFHQWRDNRQVYGLNFSSKEDAHIFALAMVKALEAIDQNNSTLPRSLQSQVVPPHYQQQQPIYQIQQYQQPVYQEIGQPIQNGHVETYFWNREESGGEKRQSALQYVSNTVGEYTSNSHPVTLANAPPSGSSHNHSPSSSLATPPLAPPAVSTPLSGQGAPPAPPPPPFSASQTLPRQGSSSGSPMSLATALQTANLRSIKVSESDITRSAPVGLMDEITKTLARRRAQVENSQHSQDEEITRQGVERKRSWGRLSSVNGLSPEKRGGSESSRNLLELLESGDKRRANRNHSVDVDKLKQEILTEMKKEIIKMKQDIIEVIRKEFARR
ncbi:vasodilator-stimulated phosphoprotein-like isoform X2 [Limulus polyphemus]|uniref:Vasodilator-stimulated phosphoprotein-like isoform X2 n=1 Tax=Limulus polyphemus TaxID=6850 RepID=A0ABM1RUD7_LIMPO|nr:vasodilator-stimulated phosphoprotein-like isoform X2 [Limulus polyphemus]